MNKVLVHTNLITGEDVYNYIKPPRRKKCKALKQVDSKQTSLFQFCEDRCNIIEAYSFSPQVLSGDITQYNSKCVTTPKMIMAYYTQPWNIRVITVQAPIRKRSLDEILDECIKKPNFTAQFTNDDEVIHLIYVLPNIIDVREYPHVQKYIRLRFVGAVVAPYTRQSLYPIWMEYMNINFVHCELIVSEADIKSSLNR